MKLVTQTTVVLTFYVEYYQDSERSMASETFSDGVSTLEQAVEQWRLAKATRPDHDWIITTKPEVNVGLGKGGAA